MTLLVVMALAGLIAGLFATLAAFLVIVVLWMSFFKGWQLYIALCARVRPASSMREFPWESPEQARKCKAAARDALIQLYHLKIKYPPGSGPMREALKGSAPAWMILHHIEFQNPDLTEMMSIPFIDATVREFVHNGSFQVRHLIQLLKQIESSGNN